MSPSFPARMTVWLVSIFVGALGWWMASGIATELFGWPRASYGQALGVQFSVHLIAHSFFIALGSLVREQD